MSDYLIIRANRSLNLYHVKTKTLIYYKWIASKYFIQISLLYVTLLNFIVGRINILILYYIFLTFVMLNKLRWHAHF